jgi:hypothetical protein
VKRSELLREVSDRLGDDQVVWFGTRGDDVESVTELPQFAAAFSIISRYGRRSTVTSLALEELTNRRVDLDTFELDDEPPRSPEMLEFRRSLLRCLARRSVVFTYRPTAFLSGVCFARRDRCRYVGMFKDHQAAFEHKPWVETEIAALGVPRIPWAYVADDDQLDTLRFLDTGPVMLRRSRTTGGVGFARVDDPSQLGSLWPEEHDAYVSVAPYIEGVPLNVSGVVWQDGVTLHPASFQLIGVPSLTRRPFGYCGNDFGAVRDLDLEQLRVVEDAVVSIGDWLRRHGYRGAFGADFLVDAETGIPLFTEVNPRFQGSTHASCRIAVESDESCLLLEHIAASLGVPAPPSRSLGDWRLAAGAFGHFVAHSTHEVPIHVDPIGLLQRIRSIATTDQVDVLACREVLIDPEATIARVSVRDRITSDGFDLHPAWQELIQNWLDAPLSAGGTNDRVAELPAPVSP